MLKLSKVVLVSLLVVSLTAPFAAATTSRVQALAGTANYINDDSNIFSWYGTLPSYTKLVMAEMGQYDGDSDSQALGFTHSWGEDHWLGTWGIFLLRNSIDDMSFYLFNPLGTFGKTLNLSDPTLTDISTPSSKFVISWGNKIDMLSYGMNFTRSDVSIETPTTGTNDIGFTTVGGGVRLDLGDKAYTDVAVTLGFADGDTIGGFDNGFSYDLSGRIFWEWLDDVTLVPFVRFGAYDFAFTDPTGGLGAHGDKVSDFTVGASLNMDVNTNNMLIFATELNFFNWELSKKGTPADQSEIQANTLPKFYVALESEIRSWLTARAGATKAMMKITDKDAAGDEDIFTNIEEFLAGSDDFEWFLGLGFHVAEFDIDAVIGQDLPFSFGYYLTGYSDGDPPVTRLSVTYHF